jgi:hydroxyacylglutathione hydrolase
VNELRVARLRLGEYGTNCYLVAREGSPDAVVVDPGDEPERVLEALSETGSTARAILVTHGHPDHIGAVRDVAAATGAEVWMPRGEADDLRSWGPAPYDPEHLLDGGETVSTAGFEFATYLVPGHTRASLAYATGGVLFGGDVLFAGSVGRTDLDGGDTTTLLASIARLFDVLPPDTVVLSGHGPETTLAAERDTNPFLGALRR